MKWYWVVDEKDHFKRHVIPNQLLIPVLRNLCARAKADHTEIAFKNKLLSPTDKVTVDLGGAMPVNASYHDIKLEGLLLHIPSFHVPLTLEYIRKLPLRTELGKRPYYKAHFFCGRCLCLTPRLHGLLIKRLGTILPECLAIEAAENADFNEKFSKPHPHVMVEPRRVPVRIEES